MSKYVAPIEQLVTEIVVRDIKRSTDFYRRLGFELLRDGGDFVELIWEDHRLFLAELSAFPEIVVRLVSDGPAYRTRTARCSPSTVWKRKAGTLPLPSGRNWITLPLSEKLVSEIGTSSRGPV